MHLLSAPNRFTDFVFKLQQLHFNLFHNLRPTGLLEGDLCALLLYLRGRCLNSSVTTCNFRPPSFDLHHFCQHPGHLSISFTSYCMLLFVSHENGDLCTYRRADGRTDATKSIIFLLC